MGEKNLFFLKKSLQIELMVFSDVLAVLFEELFCLKEKKMLHMICTAANRQKWSELDIFEGILKVTFKANTWALCNVNKTLCLWTFQLIWFFFFPYMPSDVQVLNVFVSVFSFVNGINIVTWGLA